MNKEDFIANYKDKIHFNCNIDCGLATRVYMELSFKKVQYIDNNILQDTNSQTELISKLKEEFLTEFWNKFNADND